jgi:diacylglycerol kinase family enzyme
LARHLKIPLDPKKALQLISKGNIMQMDYGKINDRLFFCTTGVGFDAHIGHVFANTKSRGFANYLKATVSEFMNYKPKRYEIRINKKTIIRRAFLITVANASQYGNNAHIAPKAMVNDGQMEVAIMSQFPIHSAPILGARLFLKTIDKSNYIETYSCHKLTIRRKHSGVVHFDGEPGKMGKELKIKIFPKGLNVFVN